MNPEYLDRLLIPTQPNFPAIDSLIITRLPDGSLMTRLIRVAVGQSHDILVGKLTLTNLFKKSLSAEVKKGMIYLVLTVPPAMRTNYVNSRQSLMDGKQKIAWNSTETNLKRGLDPVLGRMIQACIPFDLEALVKGEHSRTTTGYDLSLLGGIDNIDPRELVSDS